MQCLAQVARILSCFHDRVFNIHEVFFPSHLQFSFNINYWDNWKTVLKPPQLSFSKRFQSAPSPPSLKINGKLIFYPIISRWREMGLHKFNPAISPPSSPRFEDFSAGIFWRGPTSCPPRITVNPSYLWGLLPAKINRGRFRFCRLWGGDASKDIFLRLEVARSRISLRKWNTWKGGEAGENRTSGTI